MKCPNAVRNFRGFKFALTATKIEPRPENVPKQNIDNNLDKGVKTRKQLKH